MSRNGYHRRYNLQEEKELLREEAKGMTKVTDDMKRAGESALVFGLESGMSNQDAATTVFNAMTAAQNSDDCCDEFDLKHIAIGDRNLVEQYFVTECTRALGLDADSFDSESWRENFLSFLRDCKTPDYDEEPNAVQVDGLKAVNVKELAENIVNYFCPENADDAATAHQIKHVEKMLLKALSTGGD